MPITDAPIHATLAVADLARARAWYSDRLGWVPTAEPPGTCVYELGTSAFTLYETPSAGTAKNTVMNWKVADLRAEVVRLRGRGVVFEEYDFGDYRTVDGIMTEPGGMQAWFTDPDGNIVGIGQGQTDARVGLVSAQIAAADLARAKAWYSEKLGFEPLEEVEGVLLGYGSAGSWFSVYESTFAGTARNTVGIWRLKGLVDEVGRLRSRGVVFEDYDFGDGDKTVDGIISDAEGPVNAWFKDSEGNILGIAEDRA